jgi:hypothetical protein
MGVVERLLVDTLVKDEWFLRRYRFLAADLVNHTAGIAYESKKGADFGSGFANNTDSFHRIHRHIIDLERSFFTHLAELERRQTIRRRLEPEIGPSVTDSPQKENPEIGFVPQPAPVLASTSVPAHNRPLPPSSEPSAPTVETAQPRYTGNSDCISPFRPWQK